MNYLKFLLHKFKYLKNNKYSIDVDLNNPKIVLLGSPEYNNLGDHAIAFATKLFIEDNIKDMPFYQIPEDEIKYNFNKIKKIINKNDILLLQGGGNMGDGYLDQVYIRKKVIKEFKDNKIIIMPQTINFEKNKQKLPSYYFKHNNIFIFAREEKSYEIFNKIFIKDKVFLVPDIVMYLINKDEYKKFRTDDKYVLLCIRKDKESANNNFEKYSEEILKELNLSYRKISTVTEKSVKENEREKALINLFKRIAQSKVFITDRLHGMIIASIVGTPCIVLPTFNHKVVCSYNWLKNLKYVELIDDKGNIKETLQKFIRIRNTENNKIDLDYSSLLKVIKGEI